MEITEKELKLLLKDVAKPIIREYIYKYYKGWINSLVEQKVRMFMFSIPFQKELIKSIRKLIEDERLIE
jgi:hypothetical protein